MASAKSTNFRTLIEAFLADHDNPTNDQWKALISAHPEHLTAIVDAAISHGANKNISDIPDPAFFDKEVFDQTISKVLSLAEKSARPALEEVEKKVNRIKGPVAKKVAVEIGLGSYPSLLNDVLFGRTRPPQRVYESLSAYFDAPIAALSEVFRRQFGRTEAPAFKAMGKQPTVRTEPCSWEEAVRDLQLPRVETDRLLKLAD